MPEKTLDNINRQARDYFQKAQVAMERSNLDYAIEMLIQCLAQEPNFLQGRKVLRAVQMKKAESGSKLGRMFTSAKSQPLMAKAQMILGKNPVEAMVLAEQVLTEDPKNGQALQLLAKAAESAGHYETVVQTLDHYSRLNPRDTKNLHWLARTHAHLQRFDLARDIYEKILQISPGDFEAQKAINDATARGAMQGGGWDQAQTFRDALKDKNESAALEQENRVVRAEDMIANLIKENLAKLEQDPNNPLFQRELGKLYSQAGEYDTALAYLEKIFASEAGADPSLEKEIGEIRNKRLETAIEQKKKALAATPDNATLQAEIAQLEKERVQLQVAEAEKLVDRYPNDLMYRYDLGVLYRNAGDLQQAVEQFQRAVSQPQRRVASLNFLGQCFCQMGLADLAIDQYLKAIEEVPSMDGVKKELTYNLAAAYEEIGETDKAVTEYKKIAAVDFGYRDVRQKIMRRPTPPKPA